MITSSISTLLIVSQLALSQVGLVNPVKQVEPVVIGERSISLENRQINRPLNEIYKDNILLNMAYMRGVVTKGSTVNWDTVRAPFEYEFVLQPGEKFAFHDEVS